MNLQAAAQNSNVCFCLRALDEMTAPGAYLFLTSRRLVKSEEKEKLSERRHTSPVEILTVARIALLALNTRTGSIWCVVSVRINKNYHLINICNTLNICLASSELEIQCDESRKSSYTETCRAHKQNFDRKCSTNVIIIMKLKIFQFPAWFMCASAQMESMYTVYTPVECFFGSFSETD